jgi:hypothetical protein
MPPPLLGARLAAQTPLALAYPAGKFCVYIAALRGNEVEATGQ